MKVVNTILMEFHYMCYVGCCRFNLFGYVKALQHHLSALQLFSYFFLCAVRYPPFIPLFKLYGLCVSFYLFCVEKKKSHSFLQFMVWDF
jgi:hypothetical protein